MATTERQFTDESGMDWTVREIVNPTMPPALSKLLGADRRASGWLVFLSASGERRRLSPFPPDWGTVTDFELARWCTKARSVPPAPSRRRQDL